MIKLKLNVPLNGYKAGAILELETDAVGGILDSFWARRLKDSKIDNCVEVVKENKNLKKRAE